MKTLAVRVSIFGLIFLGLILPMSLASLTSAAPSDTGITGLIMSSQDPGPGDELPPVEITISENITAHDATQVIPPISINISEQIIASDVTTCGIPPLSIGTASLPNGQRGVPYNKVLAAAGGSGKYSWSKSSGELPPGLSIAASTGTINGIPTKTGTYQFQVQVNDGANSVTKDLSITINLPPPPPVIIPVVTTPPPVTVTSNVTSFSGKLTLDAAGVAQAPGKLTTTNGEVSIDIAAGTKLLDSNAKPLSNLDVSPAITIPPPADSYAIILPYTFSPDGATFSPDLTLTIKYNPTTLPAGVAASDLIITSFDGKQWILLPSKVDLITGTVSAQISHFSLYALTGKINITPTLTATPAIPSTPTVTSIPATSNNPQPPDTNIPATSPAVISPPTPEAPVTTTPSIATPSPVPQPDQPISVQLIIGIIGASIVVMTAVLLIGKRKRNFTH